MRWRKVSSSPAGAGRGEGGAIGECHVRLRGSFAFILPLQAQDLSQDPRQAGLGQGFYGVSVEVQIGGKGRRWLPGGRRDEDHRQVLVLDGLAHAAQESPAVEIGHELIDQGRVQGRIGLARQGQGLGAILRHQDGETPGPAALRQVLAAGGEVIGDEQGPAPSAIADRDPFGGPAFLLGRAAGQAQLKAEGAAMGDALATQHLDPPAHGVGQLLGDRQAQAQAGDPLVTIEPPEGLEDRRQLRFGDAHAGIGDVKRQVNSSRRRSLSVPVPGAAGLRRCRCLPVTSAYPSHFPHLGGRGRPGCQGRRRGQDDAQLDGPALGELAGVFQQITQDLRQPLLVGHDPIPVADAHPGGEDIVAAGGQGAADLTQVEGQLGQGQGGRIEPRGLGLAAAEGQDVTDQVQQAVGAVLDDPQVIPRGGRDLTGQQLGIAKDIVQGARNSWLTVERKADLA